ncbi:hypothetical protein SynBIOSE41_02811 [Synechococcus sp. BIOS-E4-1]|nr:hypothetical protein SynBIOSE41_02811 [Synechococcus sp. BIOS-E4-1]
MATRLLSRGSDRSENKARGRGIHRCSEVRCLEHSSLTSVHSSTFVDETDWAAGKLLEAIQSVDATLVLLKESV